MESNQRVAFTGAKVFDAIDGKAREGKTLIIDGGKIVDVVDTKDASEESVVIDATGHTIMPGLIDTHVHFAHMYTGYLPYRADTRWGYISAWTVWGMERMLTTGVTSARDLGGLDSGYVDAEEKGLIRGPRLKGNAVQFMMPTNGSTDWLLPWGGTTSALGHSIIPPGLPDPHCDGPWECRKRAREVLLAGAEVLKIGSGGCLAQRQYRHTNPTFTREEIDVFVDEGRRQGVPVHCHVLGGQGLSDAIDSGVDCIEHGCELDERMIEQMAEQGTWWVPTFWIIELHSRLDPTEQDRDLMKRFLENSMRNLEIAHRAGVPIAMGSDGGSHDQDNSASLMELAYMVDAGMSEADVLVASTRKAAELVGASERVGTIEAGREADLIIVEGDPLEDIKILQNEERRKLVLKSGEAVGGVWCRSQYSGLLSASSQAGERPLRI